MPVYKHFKLRTCFKEGLWNLPLMKLSIKLILWAECVKIGELGKNRKSLLKTYTE